MILLNECEMSETETFALYKYKTAEILKCHADDIEIEMRHVPVSSIFPTSSSIGSFIVLICVNRFTKEAVKFITPY